MRTFEERENMYFLLMQLQHFKQNDGYLWFHFTDIAYDYAIFEKLTDDEFIRYTGVRENKPRHQFPNSRYEVTLAGRRILHCPSEWVHEGVICPLHYQGV